MPYVQKKTWIQMAPRIRGLSLKESQSGFSTRGMGQDDSDFSTFDAADMISQSVFGSPATPVMTGPTPSAASVAQTATPTGSLALTSWLQSNQTLVLLIGAGMLGFVFLAGAMKR
jgi:hypothetical protein